MKAPHRKGKAFELWVSKRLRNALDAFAERSPHSGALWWIKGDVVSGASVLQGDLIECKAQETWSLPAWIRKARTQASSHRWFLALKRKYELPVVVMDFEDWLNLLAELQELRGAFENRPEIVRLDTDERGVLVTVRMPTSEIGDAWEFAARRTCEWPFNLERTDEASG